MSELLKLPVLVAHYSEHKQWDGSITFLQYLRMHYAEHDDQNADYRRDQQLPFKTLAHSPIAAIAFVLPAVSVVFLAAVSFREKRQKRSFHTLFYTSQYLANVWQPPKSL